MLFLKEKREQLPAEMLQNGSLGVSTLLGKEVKVFLVSADEYSKTNAGILV